MSFFWFTSGLHAQVLGWNYEDILTDVQESGANPDLAVAPNGDFHISYWQKELDKLAYAVQDRNNGSVAIEIIPDANRYGYKSAIVLDNNGAAHIAYISSNAANSVLRYATNESGSWVTEAVLPTLNMGAYGPDLIFPTYLQHSLDIELDPQGRPIILFFHSDPGLIFNCPETDDSYDQYELDLKIASRQNDGTWNQINFPEVDYKYSIGCISSGDRFGEYCKLIKRANGEYLAMANSLHNSEVVMFQSQPNDLNSWEIAVVDSVSRFLPGSHVASTFFEGFDNTTYATSGDSLVHLASGVANHYGFRASGTNRKNFHYTRFHPDSLGSPTYAPFYYEFPKDGFKRFFSMAVLNPDTLFIAYENLNTNEIVLTETTDGSINWNATTVANSETDAPMQLSIHQDSLYLVVYESKEDHLTLFSRSITGSVWQERDISINEQRGTSNASVIRRNGSDDEIYLAYNEVFTGQLFLGERINGNWMDTQIDQAGAEPGHLAMQLDTDGDPCVAFVDEATDEVRLACRKNGNWSVQVVDTVGVPRDLVFAVSGQALHIAWFDVSLGHMKAASASNFNGNWSVETVDNSSAIVGQRPDIITDANDGVHLTYIDVINSKVKYAIRPDGGSWTWRDVTSNQNFSPTQLSIDLKADGSPVIAFRDASTNR
ncbi:MAG: hypothetical protein AAF206_22805, partial [Bacteroidota bacterium]